MSNAPQPPFGTLSTAPAASRRTQWHRLLAKQLELVLTPLGITVQAEVQIMSDPPKVDILLLRREGERWTPEQLRFLPDGIRNTTAQHLLIEFKYVESLSLDSLQQAIGYDYFYRQAQRLARDRVQSFIVSARRPRAEFLERYDYKVTDLPGVYQSPHPLLLHIPLLVLNQLQAEPHNAFVQCFASRRVVRERAFDSLQNMDWVDLGETLWDFVSGLRARIVPGEDKMVNKQLAEELTPEKILEIGQKIRKSLLQVITPEERQAVLAKLSSEERLAVLAKMPPEERQALLAKMPPEERQAVLAKMSPEERQALLAKMSPEERLAGLPPEQRLIGLKPAELAALMAQIEKFLHQEEARSDADAQAGSAGLTDTAPQA